MTLPDAPPPGLPPISTNDTVIKPSRLAYTKTLRTNAIILIPFLVMLVLLQGWRTPILIPIYILLAGLSFGGVLLYFRVTTMSWSNGVYTYRTFLGRGKSFTAADASLVITLSALQLNLTTSTPDFIVLDKVGRKLLRLRGTFWSTDDLGPLATDLASRGVAMEAVPQPVTALQVRERHPGAIAWWEAHRIAFALIVAGGTVFFVIALTILIVVASGAFN